MVQSFFDPGHGLLSSFDERTVAVVAFLVLTVVGLVAEHRWHSKGGAVLLALAVIVVGIVLFASPLFAGEWHYAVLAAVPVVLGNYLYRERSRRRDPAPPNRE